MAKLDRDLFVNGQYIGSGPKAAIDDRHLIDVMSLLRDSGLRCGIRVVPSLITKYGLTALILAVQGGHLTVDV